MLSKTIVETATTTKRGVAETATNAETATGTAVDKLVTPGNVKNRLQTVIRDVNDSIAVGTTTTFGVAYTVPAGYIFVGFINATETNGTDTIEVRAPTTGIAGGIFPLASAAPSSESGRVSVFLRPGEEVEYRNATGISGGSAARWNGIEILIEP